MIACVLVPHFAAAVERRANPALAGVPFVIGEPPDRPERVLAVSPEAFPAGVRPGMPLKQARLLCPQARLLPTQPARYASAYTELLDVLADFSRQIEPAETGAIASSYLELGHLSSKERVELTRQIGRRVREQTRLAPALGLASGKFPPHVAAISVTPNKAIVIAPGREATFLAPRPINLLPLDDDLARRFYLLGLRTLGQLAALPAGAVLVQFGSYGRWLHRLARGQDDRPVLPHRPPLVEQLTRSLDGPVNDRPVLVALGRLMLAELANRLQAGGRLTRELRLSLYLENGIEWAEGRLLRQATADPERLGQHLVVLLEGAGVDCGVTALSVSLAGLVPATGRQLDLFTHGGEQEQRLRETLPDLLARYGPDRFYAPAVTHPAAYLPEGRFQLRPVEPG